MDFYCSVLKRYPPFIVENHLKRSLNFGFYKFPLNESCFYASCSFCDMTSPRSYSNIQLLLFVRWIQCCCFFCRQLLEGKWKGKQFSKQYFTKNWLFLLSERILVSESFEKEGFVVVTMWSFCIWKISSHKKVKILSFYFWTGTITMYRKILVNNFIKIL